MLTVQFLCPSLYPFSLQPSSLLWIYHSSYLYRLLSSSLLPPSPLQLAFYFTSSIFWLLCLAFLVTPVWLRTFALLSDRGFSFQISPLLANSLYFLSCHSADSDHFSSYCHLPLLSSLPCWFLTSILPVIIPPEFMPSVPAGEPSVSCSPNTSQDMCVWACVCQFVCVCLLKYDHVSLSECLKKIK